jgi:structural maintenance of chromosome 2
MLTMLCSVITGKITKVLNMKPPEILGMIEEAAGTSMFEDKKDKAQKTMAKKEKKIEEIQTVRFVLHYTHVPRSY